MIHLQRLYAHNFKQLQEVELHFPAHARVLVQGKNEAGKSTLFEALYFALFGAALATETGARGLDDLIRYEVEKARVELDVRAGARVFKIRRTITRGKTNQWELDVCAGDAVDEIRGNTVVNKRLIAELGFDGDALLNTCFVEQKKLEKLEGLTRAKREESLAKLLNLDALVQIENELKVRGEDKQELDRLKKRADLAMVQSELPAFEAELAKTETHLQLIDLRGAVTGAITELRAVQHLAAQTQSLIAQRDQIAARVTQIETLKEAMLAVKEARDAVERAADSAREIERWQQEQTAAQRRADSIPQLQTRGFALRRLAHFLARAETLGNARERSAQRAQKLAAAETRHAELRATIARAQAALAQTEHAQRAGDRAEALATWIAARKALAPAQDAAARVAEMRAQHTQLTRQFRRQVFAFAALIVILGLAGALAPALALAFLVIALLGVFALAWRVMSVWRESARLVETLGQAEGEARARQIVADEQAVRLREIEATFAPTEIPANVAQAQAEREEIARELNGKPRDAVRAEQAAARERLAQARAQLDELERQNAVSGADALSDARAQTERAIQKAERLTAAWRARLQLRADALAVALDGNAVQRARYQLDAEIQQIQKRANDGGRLADQIAQREQQTHAFWARAQEAYERARAIQPNAPAWHAAFTLDDYTAFGKELRARYDTLGGEAAVKQARELEGELGRRQGEHTTRAHNAALLVARVRDVLFQVGTRDVPAALDLGDLEQVATRVRALDLGDEAALRAKHRELVGRVHSFRDRQTQLERDLGLVNVALEHEACRVEWEAKLRQLSVRERGGEIVALARKRIVQKILPATMDHMRQILPTLTRDRYHDAQLDPETYKIQAWDERAGNGGAFKEKNIFSGGTKDQFSLALRLAFALATLPQERGTAPSFIFLDEPLGSFDAERADALIYLLTEGEIARAFDQIFLISHVHVNERLFTHRLVLENGRVALTDLGAIDSALPAR